MARTAGATHDLPRCDGVGTVDHLPVSRKPSVESRARLRHRPDGVLPDHDDHVIELVWCQTEQTTMPTCW